MPVQQTKREVKLNAFYLARSNKTPYAVHKTYSGFWKASKLTSLSPRELVYLVYYPNGKHRAFTVGRAAEHFTQENPPLRGRKRNPISTISGSGGGGWQAAHAFRQLPDGRVQILTNPRGRVPKSLV
jgi:hypothetical protein